MIKYSPKKYEEMDRLALDLRRDYGFFGFEIDVFLLAEYLGAKLIKYSSLSYEQLSEIEKSKELNDGFTTVQNINGELTFLIYYRDDVTIGRQRYTIAHEIKHVVCRETVFTEEDEHMAEHFARVLLAPSCLMLMVIETHSVFDIARLFNISEQAAENAYIATLNRKNSPRMKLKDYEKEFIKIMNSNLAF